MKHKVIVVNTQEEAEKLYQEMIYKPTNKVIHQIASMMRLEYLTLEEVQGSLVAVGYQMTEPLPLIVVNKFQKNISNEVLQQQIAESLEHLRKEQDT